MNLINNYFVAGIERYCQCLSKHLDNKVIFYGQYTFDITTDDIFFLAMVERNPIIQVVPFRHAELSTGIEASARLAVQQDKHFLSISNPNKERKKFINEIIFELKWCLIKERDMDVDLCFSRYVTNGDDWGAVIRCNNMMEFLVMENNLYRHSPCSMLSTRLFDEMYNYIKDHNNFNKMFEEEK